MRCFKLTLSSLVLAFAICTPALAQSGPTSVQYVGDSADVGESADAFAHATGQGTDAVNDAMSGVASPSASPSASDDASVSPEGVPTGSDTDGGAGVGSDTAKGDDTGGASTEATTDAARDSGPDSITVLPETGGAAPTTLAAGTLLVVLGLAARKVAER